MANNDPLDQVDTTNLDVTNPVIPWTSGDFDGFIVRNQHDAALAARDVRLLQLIRAVKDRGNANVSPLYPFKDDATLVPSSAIAYTAAGSVISAFVIDPTKLALTNGFIKDMRLILSNEFRNPYLNLLRLRKAVDPDSGMVHIYVDLYFNAQYTADQTDQNVLKLVGKAFNDVQDNSAPSSCDNKPLDMVQVPVESHNFLNSGLIEFHFIGSVQNSGLTSWSAGVYSSVLVEGFASVPGLDHIDFTFTYPATKIAQLAYNNLGDITNAVPFLAKVKNFPFDAGSTAGSILAKVIPDIEISAPANTKVFIKRVRVRGSNYVFVFAYNTYDAMGNLTGLVNIGVATVTPTANRVQIQSLGSNTINGASPNWLDEIPGTTVDSYGAGTLVVTSAADITALFNTLLSTTISIGSPSPLIVSPAAPPPIFGIAIDPTQIDMVEINSYLDGLAKDIVALPVTFTERVLSPAQPTRSVVVAVNGMIVNRRCCYGPESDMRLFYGLTTVESLVDSTKIVMDDEWFDTTQSVLKRYQLVAGHLKWRTV